MIYSFKGFIPVIHPSAFVHPQACVTGNVHIGANVYIGPGAALRGDWGSIFIHEGCNVQENCTLHMFPGASVILHAGAHLGHGCIVHGATIGANSLIGMNAVLMDDVVIGEESIVGALSFVSANSVFEKRSIIVGNPAKIVGQVSDEKLAWKTKGTQLYQSLPAEMKTHWQECEPLSQAEPNRPSQEKLYETWNSIKGK
jgi:phenylacetic acid degradation protein